jgi:hypothetical protein
VDFATGHRDLVAGVCRQPASRDAEPPLPEEDLEAFLLARVNVERHGSADREAPLELEQFPVRVGGGSSKDQLLAGHRISKPLA